MPSVTEDLQMFLEDIHALDEGWMRGKYTLVVHSLERADYQFPVRNQECNACGHSLQVGSGPNPRVAVHLETGRAWHEECHDRTLDQEFLEDNPEEARRLIEAHRVKILERMGRTA